MDAGADVLLVSPKACSSVWSLPHEMSVKGFKPVSDSMEHLLLVGVHRESDCGMLRQGHFCYASRGWIQPNRGS